MGVMTSMAWFGIGVFATCVIGAFMGGLAIGMSVGAFPLVRQSVNPEIPKGCTCFD